MNFCRMAWVRVKVKAKRPIYLDMTKTIIME